MSFIIKKSMDNQQIVSPCISICKTDPRTGYCYGCTRTEKEKIIWKKKETTIQWKEQNIKELTQRMPGWQLETFKESYSNKLRTGLSLFKQSLMKDKKI